MVMKIIIHVISYVAILFQVFYSVSASSSALSPFWTKYADFTDMLKRICFENITIKAIERLDHTVSHLCIAHSFLSQLPENVFSNFSNLTDLILVNINLTDLPSNIFKGLKNLTKLDLSDNRLKTLNPAIFQDCDYFREFILKNNNIKEVTTVSHSLSNLEYFHYLDLSGNNLSTIKSEDLDLPYLEVLNLNHCQLNQANFSTSLKIQKLYLRNNRLTSNSLNLNSFNNSIFLRELYLGNLEEEHNLYSSPMHNYFPEINDLFLPYLPNLTLLDLQDCDITYITSTAFDTVPQLQTLNLHTNRLFTIPPSVTSMAVLKSLDLSYNGNKKSPFVLKNVDFSSMSSLASLNLSYNKIPNIEPDTFYGLKSLTKLYLKNTLMEQIEPYAFRTLHSLLYLDLSNNMLVEIVNDTFADLFTLTHINLAHNNLKIYPHNHPFLPTINLQILEFQYNSLCELWPWLIVHLPNLTHIDMSHNKIVEWRWKAFPISNSLKWANFANNEIKTIGSSMLDQLMTLEYGNFSANPYNCNDCDVVNIRKWLNSYNDSVNSNDYICLYSATNDKFVINSTLPSWCSPKNVKLSSFVVWVSVGSCLIVSFLIVALIYYFRWYLRYRWYMTRYHLRKWRLSSRRRQFYLYDAFISYSDRDRYWTKNELLPKLEGKFKCCIHDRDFEPGRNIVDNIFESIDKSKVFIAILTEDFLQSHWCIWELDIAISKMAVERKDNLVLIKLHTIPKNKLTQAVRYLLKQRTYICWPVTRTEQHLFWERLTHVLEKRTASSQNCGRSLPS